MGDAPKEVPLGDAVLVLRLIQKFFEYLAVVHGGIRYRVLLHQFVGFVRVDVVLVAVVGFVVLLGPAGIHVLLPLLVVGPVLGRRARLDPGVFFPGVALPGRFDKRGIDHLAGAGHIAVCRQLLVKPRKQRFNQLQVFEPLPE